MHLSPLRRSPTVLTPLAALAVALTACADPTVVGPSPGPGAGGPSFSVAAPSSGLVCETINFNSFAHGAAVTTVSAAGLSFAVVAQSSPDPDLPGGEEPNPFDNARAFSTTSNPNIWEDTDLISNAIAGGLCAGCTGQGNVLVIENWHGFSGPDFNGKLAGDAQFGGTITLSSATAFFIESYKAFDVDAGEPGIALYRNNATLVAQSPVTGDAGVATVLTGSQTTANSFTFRLGTLADDQVGGSGAIDDVRVCRAAALGGCTLGYFKNHTSPYENITLLGAGFVGTGNNNTTLKDALSFSGGSSLQDAKNNLMKQAAAAYLNIRHDVGYAITLGALINSVNAALASGDRGQILALADQLDDYNNAGCTLDLPNKNGK